MTLEKFSIQEEIEETFVENNHQKEKDSKIVLVLSQDQPGTNNVDKVGQYLQGKNISNLDATDHLMMGYAKAKLFNCTREAKIMNQSELKQIQQQE
ncbi:hypothetical protein J6590_068573 [Homalodisca vitripennis]|nr:hypothetical protein J6590_068573 [Homalodisca vitripennis]